MSSLEVPRAEAARILAPHLASGTQLILSAAMVGDEDDFGVWSWRCKDWTTRLGGALRYIYGDDDARVFDQATRLSRPAGGWQAALRGELEQLRETLDMLGELSDQSSNDDARSQAAQVGETSARVRR